MNGFLMRNGNFIACDVNMSHMEHCQRLGYNSMEELYNGGLLRVGYINNCICVDGNDISWRQLLFIQNRCRESKMRVYIDLFDAGANEWEWPEFSMIETTGDLKRQLV